MTMSVIVRLFLMLAAPITALFVSRDALNFDVLQTIVAVVLFTVAVAAIAFWPRRPAKPSSTEPR
jgi:hypothetical protein